MTEEEMIARGKEIFEECYGGVIPLPEEIDPKGYSGLSMKMFNDVWGDGRLSFREKRLVVLGALAGLGADPSLFEIHAKSALGNGELRTVVDGVLATFHQARRCSLVGLDTKTGQIQPT